MRCVALLLVLVLFIIPRAAPATHNTEIVRNWANKIGDELWNLTLNLTNIRAIEQKYMQVPVKTKNEAKILDSTLESVARMLTRKINAVKCIHHRAQDIASKFSKVINMTKEKTDNFTYCSSKYSHFVEKSSNATNESSNTTEESSNTTEESSNATEESSNTTEENSNTTEESSNTTKEAEEDKTPECAKKNAMHYVNVTLDEDSHFYKILVNTSRSCVQVPTNIYDQEADALEAIMWSEGLDETFRKNYQSDPSLSWQYFGSSTGILRFFPGMPWNKKVTDEFDCRVRSWYIEAATCSKDVIVLFDVSGSMTGFRNYVARATLKTLLETLSNNDYVNVYYFKNETKVAVQCFEDLVQATPENLKTITEALEPTEGGKKHKVPLEGYANLTTAYITAFEKLKKRRVNLNCSNDNQGCNQLVMLITDYVPGNLTEVFEAHNREEAGENENRIPVRVFTYLIGKEVTNVREIQWMACLNRGYYVHIHSIEEVQQQVLKYINVIARPMILEGEEPPPTWTHAYIDETRTYKWGVSKQTEKPDADKLVASVAIPAFKSNNNTNETKAELLGVAGTDVPIDSIAKLAQPHQLGVNGYSFIVSNNGYVLLHPYLVPSIDGKLQVNLNSIDIVEVEQVDDGKLARVLGEDIKKLRNDMVQGKEGNLTNIPVLFHYDRMRRIAQVRQNYFYQQLEDTPFSLGISLPVGYGNTSLEGGNTWEVDLGKYVAGGIKITNYFNSSYRVHPDWVYCKYHYLEGHEFDTLEREVWDFLQNMTNEDWKWSEQYTNDNISSQNFTYEKHCKKQASLGKDDYYCNKDLIQMLVFDAKLTDPFFKTWNGSAQQLEMANLYKVDVRFISTSSGLTRWHYLEEGRNEHYNDKGEKTYKDPAYNGNHTKVFGDLYPRAIEETWYMAAVLQHVIRDETLVVAVNLTADVNNTSDNITITASYAIFAKNSQASSPASVVGIQFQYDNWRERFESVTNNSHYDVDCPNCIEFCNNSIGVACYLIDSSGYIVMSEDRTNVRKFFGEVEPLVMYDLVHDNYTHIFNETTVYDYQALCGPEDLMKNVVASAWRFGTPFSAARMLGRWLLTQLLWLVNDVILVATEEMFAVSDNPKNAASTTPTPPSAATAAETEKDDADNEQQFSCDKEVHLYILLPGSLDGGSYEKDEAGNCTPAYTAVMVKHTNLLFVAVDKRNFTALTTCKTVDITTKPKPTEDSTKSRIPCHKLSLGNLERRRLAGCFTYHKKEAEIDDCGHGSRLRQDLILVATAVFVAIARFLLR